MDFSLTEYNLGEVHIDTIKNTSLIFKILDSNASLVGKVLGLSKSQILILYVFDFNNNILEFARTTSDSLGYYKFQNILIGSYLIKDDEFNVQNVSTNLFALNSSSINMFPWRSFYNVSNGYLENGARLNSTKDKVLFLGGPDKGSASIYVCGLKDSMHNMEIDYIGGRKSFNIDINGINTGEVYTTGASYFGKIIISLKLNRGYNLIKFYGNDNNFAPTLGIFTITAIESTQKKYNLINAILENGARINFKKDMVIYLGGNNNGIAKIVVTIKKLGYYLVNIKFRCGLRSFLVAVNGISTGEVYTVQSEYEGNFSFQVFLTRTSNEIKFYGLSNRITPSLGEFELTYIENVEKPMPKPTPIPIDPKPIPPKVEYNCSNGILEYGAIVDRGFVLYVGGYNRGAVKIEVDVEMSGKYNIDIKFLYGGRPFKMDINNIDTGNVYYTQYTAQSFSSKDISIFTTVVNLKSGKNTIKFYGIESEHASFFSSFTLEFALELPPEPPVQPNPQPPPIDEYYSVTKGVLQNGARLSNDKNFVMFLGGRFNGSSTVEINVDETGRYAIEVDFQNGYRPLKIDVNNKFNDIEYTTPPGHVGKFTTVIDLKSGKNTIKFYGVQSQYSSNLGKFTLNFIPTPVTPVLPSGTYDVANGRFENGATLDLSTNFVIYLGGINDGSTTLNVNVKTKGTYKIKLKYLSAEENRNLSIDINGINIGLYTPPLTTGWALIDTKTFTFQVVLNAGDNKIKFHGDGVNMSPRLGTFVINPVTVPPQLPSYTFENLNKLNYSDLINVIKTISWSDVPGLFNFSSDSYKFFRDNNRVQAIIDALEESGNLFTNQQEQGIDTLVEFLRAAFYLGYNNSQLSSLYNINYRNKCLPAIKAVIANPNFKLGTNVQDKIVKAIGKLLGNASADIKIVNDLAIVLEQYKNNIEYYSSENDKNQAIFKIVKETTFFLGKEVIRNGNDPQSTSFYDKIDLFINQVEKLAEEAYKLNSDLEWLAKNFINLVGDLSKFRRNKNITIKSLTNCLRLYPNSSGGYLEVLSQINENFNNTLSDGTVIDYNQKKEEAKRSNLPNLYSFDDGSIIVKTGNRVSGSKVKKAYWASKEVKAQFVRITGNDTPLDIGNVDDILTIIIYNSPKHYEINYQLYGHSTDNGGLYVESEGTFYTYDREVPRDSVFSLEELFRHEYTHYLQNRFLIKGVRPNTNFYRGNPSRLTWFTEGSAEFFAGATRKEGVKARRTMVSSLANDSNNIFSLSTLFSSSSGFNFYKYGFAFVYYMYDKNVSQLHRIATLIKTDNVAGYENYVQNLRSDTTTNALYYQTINELIQSLGNLTTPSASDEYLAIHPYMTVNQISFDISSVLYITNIYTETKTSNNFETVTLRGNYNNGISIDSISDWNSMNQRLDNALRVLETKGWSGYNTFTAYFLNYKVTSAGNATFDVVFHGILRSI